MWEGIIKLEAFVIFDFLKQRALSRRKKKKRLKMSLIGSQGEKHHKGHILTPASMAAPTELAGHMPPLHLPSKHFHFHKAF